MKKQVKNIFKVLISIIILISLVGCSEPKVKIGYTVYPVEYLVERIGGDFTEAIPISDGKLAMRSTIRTNYPEIMKEIQVLFTMGGLEPFLDIYMEELSEYKTSLKDLTAKSGIFEFARFTKVNLNGKDVYAKSSYYDSPKFKSIDVYAKDPNLWLDPVTMTSMAKQVRDYLIEIDPDRTNIYKDNYSQLELDLAHLDSEYLELRKRDSQLKLATMTPSFGIWQKNYDIEIYPIVLSKYGVIPSTDQLELIKQRLVSDQVKYIVTEPGLTKDLVELCDDIAEELDLKVISLSSLSYITETQRKEGKDYMDIMKENLKVLDGLE